MVGVTLLLSWLLTTAAVGLAGWYAVRSHRQFTRRADAFRCQLRVVSGELRGLGPDWRQGAGWASWAHDVLLVRTGHLPATMHVLQVRFPEGSVEPVGVGQGGVGTEPVVLRLRLDDGVVVDVAASATDRDRLPGPFLVACLDNGSVGTKRPPRAR